MAVVQDLGDRQAQVAPWGKNEESVTLSQQGCPHRCPLPNPPPRLTQDSMGAQRKSQGICATLGDPVRKVLSLQPKGGRCGLGLKAAEEAAEARAAAAALTCAAAAMASSPGSRLPSVSLACSTWK